MIKRQVGCKLITKKHVSKKYISHIQDLDYTKTAGRIFYNYGSLKIYYNITQLLNQSQLINCHKLAK